jgi:hypothetical protein
LRQACLVGVIRYRVSQFFLPINFRFAPKADLIASTGDDSARRGDLCEWLIPAKKDRAGTRL